MSHARTSSGQPCSSSGGGGTSGLLTSGLPTTGRVPEFLRRVVHAEHMEIDSALNQMWLLLSTPTTVFKLSKARKMSKNHYYRDDPAFREHAQRHV